MLAIWKAHFRRARCRHRWQVVGKSMDRHLGECDVHQCIKCKARVHSPCDATGQDGFRDGDLSTQSFFARLFMEDRLDRPASPDAAVQSSEAHVGCHEHARQPHGVHSPVRPRTLRLVHSEDEPATPGGKAKAA